MWPAVKRSFLQEEFGAYVHEIQWTGWRPTKGIVWHNTAAPSLAQWIKSANADAEKRLTPGISRIQSLERFFRQDNGWSGCPHLFIANDLIWVMNPLNAPGVHSPSWNHTTLGIEMVGDFSTEDDDAGAGLEVKNNTIYATAVLCSALGLDPADSIYLHKQDPKTTHDCPGRDIAVDKLQMIEAVKALMAGGEHDPQAVAKVIAGNPPIPPSDKNQKLRVLTNKLNIRLGPGVANAAIGSLPKGLAVTLISEAHNGTSIWFRVRTPAGYTGWVNGNFLERITS